MIAGASRTLRFALHWAQGGPVCLEEDIELQGPDGPMHAARFRGNQDRPGPAWILLHGMTRTGVRHLSLRRFARSLAVTGSTVVVPEVPDWVGLRLAPERTADAVEAALWALEGDRRVHGPPGLMGFSFGGPQALRVSALPSLRGRLSCVASFGGYGEVAPTVRFLLTGLHEWEDRQHRVKPDPYGRWIVAANYLTRVPGFEDATPLADGLRALAAYAGDHAIESWDGRLDPIKEAIVAGLPEHWAEWFRYFAPPAEYDPPGPSSRTDRWADELAQRGVEVDPGLDPPEVLEIPVPAFLVHGYNDHLIPYTEAFRLARRVRAPHLEVTVTRLFGHSAGDVRPRSPAEWLRELQRLGGTLTRLFGEP